MTVQDNVFQADNSALKCKKKLELLGNNERHIVVQGSNQADNSVLKLRVGR